MENNEAKNSSDNIINSEKEESVKVDEQPQESTTQNIQKIAQESSQAVAKSVGDALENATSAVAEGFKATKNVHDASKETNAARQELKHMQENLSADKSALEHRTLVSNSFDEIINAQEQILADTNKEMSEQAAQVDLLTVKKNQLIHQLEQQKLDSETKLKPYKNVTQTAKGRLDDISKTVLEAQHAVKSAENQLKEITEKRDTAISSAHKALENSQARQESLRSEIQKLKSDPVANNNALIRLEDDLKAELARSAEAKKQVEEIRQSFQSTLEMAQTHYWTQTKSLESAQSSIDTAREDYNKKKQEYEATLSDSNTKQRIINKDIEQIESQIKAAKERFNEAAEKHDAAQATIEDAQTIHDTPQITEQLRESVNKQTALVQEKEDDLNKLIHGEKILRATTRGQRIGFFLIILGMVLIIFLLFWMLLNHLG